MCRPLLHNGKRWLRGKLVERSGIIEDVTAVTIEAAFTVTGTLLHYGNSRVAWWNEKLVLVIDEDIVTAAIDGE